MFRLKFEGTDHELLVHASLGAASVMLDEHIQLTKALKKTWKEMPITHIDYVDNYKETKKFIWTALMLLGPQRIKGFDAQWIAIEGLSEQWIKEQFGFFSTFSRKSTYTTWFKKSYVPYDLSQFTSKEFDKEFGHHIPDNQPQLKKQVSQILCESFISSYFDMCYDSIGLNSYTDKPVTIFSLLALGPHKLAQAFKQTAKKPKRMDFRKHEAHLLDVWDCLTSLIRSLPESVKEIDLAENEFKQLRTEDLVKILSAIPPQVNQLNLSGNELLYFSQADSDKIRAALPKTVTQVKWGDLGTARKFIGYFSVTDGVARLRSPDGSPLHDYWRRLSPAQLKEAQEEFPKEAQSFDLGEIDASLFGSQCLKAMLRGANVSELHLDRIKNLHRLGGERIFNVLCTMRPTVTTLHLEFAELVKLGLDGLIHALDATPDSVKTFKFRDGHANLLSPQEWHMLYHSLPAGKTQWIESFAPVSKAYLQGPPPQYFTLQGTVAKLNNPQGGNIDTYWNQKGWRQIKQAMKSFPKEARIMDFSGHDASVLGEKCLERLIDALPESINELWLDLKNFHCLDEKEGLDVCFLAPISRSKNITKILLEPNELGKLAAGRIEKFIFRLGPRVSFDVIEPPSKLQLTKSPERSPSSHEAHSSNTAGHPETKPVSSPLKEVIPAPQVAPQSASTPQELKPLAHADSTPSSSAKNAHCLNTSNPSFFTNPTLIETAAVPQADASTEQQDSLLRLIQKVPNVLQSLVHQGLLRPGAQTRMPEHYRDILALLKQVELTIFEDFSKLSLDILRSLFVALLQLASEYSQGQQELLSLITELMVLFPDLAKGAPHLQHASIHSEPEPRTFSLC